MNQSPAEFQRQRDPNGDPTPGAPTALATRNGMPATNLAGVSWRKGGRSSAQGNCVEAARLPGGGVAIRNSRDPGGPALIFTDAEMRAFLGSVRDGDFDDLHAS